MTSITAAGTALAISAGVPATQDAAGYAALTYTEISQIDKIGVIGAVFSKVEFTPLKGPKQKHKGAFDGGTLSPTLAHDDADAGQTLLRASAASNNLYAFKVTYPDGAVRYFQGRTFGYPENIDGADSIITATPSIEISTAIVKVAAS